MRPSGNRISARVPGGTSTCRFSVSPSSVHDDVMRPYGQSWVADAEVRPPPGTGSMRKVR
jgi:hypothetical protein